jgi:hypothetical protein
MIDPWTAIAVGRANGDVSRGGFFYNAGFYFQYDFQHRVVFEQLESGRKEFTFSYWTNPDAPDYSDVNVWNTQTIETLPDGSQNRVYSNAASQPLLTILQEAVTGYQWYSYIQYDTLFNQILQANSAAVASVTEPTLSDYTLTVNLHAAGLIQCQVFYTSTDPSIGAVQNRLQMQTVQQGTAGTPVTVRSFTYASQTAFGQTIYPVSSQSVYPAGSAVTTSFAFTYYVAGSAPTFQVQQQTITYPAVPSDQNGSGIAGAEQSYYDTYGRLIWYMNQQGAISYTAYDNATGAVIQQIADVNTALMTGARGDAGSGLNI